MQIGDELVCSKHGGVVRLTPMMKRDRKRVCDSCVAAYKAKWAGAKVAASLEARRAATALALNRLQGEEWRAVPGFPGYEVSSTGRVRSLNRLDTDGRQCVGVVLRPYTNNRGYVMVRPSRDGKPRTTAVHVLVALAFIGPRPAWPHHVAHGDGNRTNNSPSNLRYATPAENEADKEAHGTKFIAAGSKNGHAKLNEAQVSEIRSRILSGERNVSIAKHYGVDPSVVSHIKRGKLWKHHGI